MQELTIERKLDILNWKADLIIMSQTDINNAVTAITALLTDVGNQTSSILTAVTAIQAALAAGQPVDTTALDSVVAGVQQVDTALDTAVGQLGSLVPAPGGATPPPSTPTAQFR
jgi:hypothetical protein